MVVMKNSPHDNAPSRPITPPTTYAHLSCLPPFSSLTITPAVRIPIDKDGLVCSQYRLSTSQTHIEEIDSKVAQSRNITPGSPPTSSGKGNAAKGLLFLNG